MSDVTQLDDEQTLAVEATERAIAVLAGPGSGKTRVLSYRARYLLRKSSTSRALLLTFTNKAAAEMKSRARGVSGVASSRLTACNFHTFGAELLRAHGVHVGISPGFDILDADEARELQGAVGGARFLNHGDRWSRTRLRRMPPPAQLAEFGELYEAAKREQGVADFDDLVIYSADLLTQRADIARAYGTRYSLILVDEFQDTNAAQFEIVRALAQHADSISVFADDDQAIYGFAGADLAHIRTFVNELGAKEYVLTTNYRCRSAIVARANRLLDADPAASSRRMTAHYDGGEVLAQGFPTVDAEAGWVTSDISAQIASGRKPDEIAVLVRNKIRAREVLGCLTSESLPVSDWLGDRYAPQERRVLRTCLSIARPTLTTRQRRNLCALYELPEIAETDTEKFLGEHQAQPGLADLLTAFRLIRTEGTVSQILAVLQRSLDCLSESIGPVLENVRAFEGYDAEFTLEHLLNELALGGSGGAPTEGGGIKVATLHRTKGLQWPCVYLLGVEQDQLPDYHTKTGEDLSAERRLCFVGVCRAESRLVLTYSRSYRGYQKQPSVFLKEMNLSTS